MKILLVEDHGDSREVLSSLLRRDGHEIAMAAGMREALALLEQGPHDVLICDIGLPDGDGFTLVGEAKRRQPWKRIIALTARDEAADCERGARAGFDFYLTKPFDFHELRTLLAAAAAGPALGMGA